MFGPQLDKARRAYHKVSRKEQAAREREEHTQGNPDVAIEKQKKIQEERELAQQEAEKVRSTPSFPFLRHVRRQKEVFVFIVILFIWRRERNWQLVLTAQLHV